MNKSIAFGILKYSIILINMLLFSQTELDPRSKMMVLSCSKLLNQKYKEKEKPESKIYSKILLSCFIKISQAQTQKIFYKEEKDSFPLKSEEIEELINVENLKKIPEAEIKLKTELMNKFIQEIKSPDENLRKLVEIENTEKEENKDNKDNKDSKDNKDDDEDGIKDNSIDDMEYDPNYYGDDMDDYENMYNDYDDDYYGKYGDYDNYENMGDEDYSKMYGNDNGYNYDDDNKSFKEMITENIGLSIFIVFLIIMFILILIFGKDYEEMQTLEVDPNKDKNE